MACVETYSPGEVSLIIALLYEAQGFSPNSIISLSKDENYFTTQKGSTGGVERTAIADNTYTLEISLAQTSSTNSVLNALATVDSLSKSGIFPIFAKDSSGQSLFLASSCWIESPATASYTGSIETRTWTIKCSDVIFGLAGNSEDDSVLAQITRLATLAGQFGNASGIL